jgi:hypothetical protein
MLVRAANIQDHVVVERLAIALAQQERSGRLEHTFRRSSLRS